jgi:hypothetical protein
VENQIPCVPTVVTPKKRAGRPTVRQGLFGQWLLTHEQNRAQVARDLGIDRRYLDHLARDDRRPSLELAVKIEQLTNGLVPVSYFATLAPRRQRG